MSEEVTMWGTMKTEHVASCLAASGDKKRETRPRNLGVFAMELHSRESVS